MVVYSSKKKRASRSAIALNSRFVRVVFGSLLLILAGLFSTILYVSYQDYVHPKHVYGTWIEIGSPPYDTETLILNEQGVLKNQRMIATQFEFDGSQVFVQTGQGMSIYQMSGTPKSPQLRRIQPNSPTQRFIKQGFEHTVDMEGGGIAKKRRAALKNHFENK